MSMCGNEHFNAELARLEKAIKNHEREVYSSLLKQDEKLAEFNQRFNGNIQVAISEYLRYMEQEGKLEEIITDVLLNDVLILEHKTAGIVNVKEFGAEGNGVCDDTAAIQKAINYANQNGRCVHIPKGTYLISKPIVLNGCSLIGEPGNIFQTSGTVFKCATADFTAIKQGSTGAADIMFNITDVTVTGAAVGFEFIYVINSKFERLYAVGCSTGFKLGDPSAVGSMFNEFNNLYTRNCGVGVDANSSQYFNNNRFNNGFLQGTEYAMKMKVTGGYGAIGNTFNNVEFRSETGRGIELTSCQSTTFNSCYFECGGNTIRMTNHCSIALNECVFATYKPGNDHGDTNVIYALGNGNVTINNGVIFLTENYNNMVFFGAVNPAIFQNVYVLKPITKNGSASGFEFFPAAIRGEEQVLTTGTVVAKVGEAVTVPFEYPKPFPSVPNVVVATMRGADGTANGLSYVVSERLANGGKISVSNNGTVDRSVSFSIYAKIV